MTAIELFSLIASITSIVLAIVAMVLAILTDRRAAESHLKTMEALQAIDKRSAVTENTVGDNFQKMMSTVLSIVESATADKEVQKAQLEAKAAETGTETQRQLFTMLQEVVKTGDKEKADTFLKIMQGMMQSSNLTK